MNLMENRYQTLNRRELQDIVNNSSPEVEETDKLPMYTLDMGYKEFDSTYCGLWLKELMMIAAPANTDKKTFALNVLSNIMERYDEAWSIWFSPEMSRKKILTDLLGIKSRESSEDISSGRMDGLSYSMMKSNVLKMATWPLIIDENPDFSINGIIKRCMKYQNELQKKGFGTARVIFIDHLQLIDKIDDSGDVKKPDYKVVCKRLKELAENLDATVILLCSLPEIQSGRTDKRPRKTDITKDYGKGVLDSIDTVLLLSKRDHCEYNCWQSNKYQMEVRVAKNDIMEKYGKTFRVCVDTRNLKITVPKEDLTGFMCIEGFPFS